MTAAVPYDEQCTCLIRATMFGFVAGIADTGEDRNPYLYIQAEAYAWQHGYEQGRLVRVKSDLRFIEKPIEFNIREHLVYGI